eukprot:CAMPEP_0168587664 /NCGR_PEP_ID=MMETSP0420-20121227/5003_1 /TAXON_ID=498008 /ORGANISM="Pessonella sp." /LENGTH=778 /DNA_ID=CAMNT_0008622967 /DNA_START=77 /DNA_END=2410 /DNA_ORIENTATION=+
MTSNSKELSILQDEWTICCKQEQNGEHVDPVKKAELAARITQLQNEVVPTHAVSVSAERKRSMNDDNDAVPPQPRRDSSKQPEWHLPVDCVFTSVDGVDGKDNTGILKDAALLAEVGFTVHTESLETMVANLGHTLSQTISLVRIPHERRLIFYYLGHGVPPEVAQKAKAVGIRGVPRLPRYNPARADHGSVPVSAGACFLHSAGFLTLEGFLSMLCQCDGFNEGESAEILVILDSCYSGCWNFDVLSDGGKQHWTKLKDNNWHITIQTSCGANQTASGDEFTPFFCNLQNENWRNEKLQKFNNSQHKIDPDMQTPTFATTHSDVNEDVPLVEFVNHSGGSVWLVRDPRFFQFCVVGSQGTSRHSRALFNDDVIVNALAILQRDTTLDDAWGAWERALADAHSVEYLYRQLSNLGVHLPLALSDAKFPCVARLCLLGVKPNDALAMMLNKPAPCWQVANNSITSCARIHSRLIDHCTDTSLLNTRGVESNEDAILKLDESDRENLENYRNSVLEIVEQYGIDAAFRVASGRFAKVVFNDAKTSVRFTLIGANRTIEYAVSSCSALEMNWPPTPCPADDDTDHKVWDKFAAANARDARHRVYFVKVPPNPPVRDDIRQANDALAKAVLTRVTFDNESLIVPLEEADFTAIQNCLPDFSDWDHFGVVVCTFRLENGNAPQHYVLSASAANTHGANKIATKSKPGGFHTECYCLNYFYSVMESLGIMNVRSFRLHFFLARDKPCSAKCEPCIEKTIEDLYDKGVVDINVDESTGSLDTGSV